MTAATPPPSSPAIAASSGAPRAIFFGSLALVTLAPFALIPALAPYGEDLPGLNALLMLTGGGHVLATLALFTDREFRPMVRANWRRFIALPLGLALAFAAIVGQAPAFWPPIFAAFMAWQLYHYQRQSFGLVMFAIKAAALKPLAGLSRVLDLTVVAGAIGLIASGTEPGLPAIAGGADALRLLALGLYLVALAALGRELARRPDICRSPLVLAMTAAAALFFLPALLPAGHLVVFWTYAAAHGAQYLIFMAALSWQAPRRPQVIATLALAAIGGGLFLLPALAVTAALQAAWLGLVCGHFLIDARVWRLRGAAQSSPVPGRFAFILGPR